MRLLFFNGILIKRLRLGIKRSLLKMTFYSFSKPEEREENSKVYT